jgi:thiazolinyl imide reductase
VQVLLCGTNYGASYVGPLLARPGGVRLAGILSRGSERSRTLARQLGVAHYTGIDRLPEGAVDAAIVAVAGEAGIALSEAFLARRIAVVAEHPWEPAALERMLSVAWERQTVFHVNAHFADLEEGAGALLRHTGNGRRPLYAHLTVNPRTLYSAIELLARALGSLEPAALAGVPAAGEVTAPSFAVLQGAVAGVALTVLCQRSVSRLDDGSATLVNHRLELGYGDGILTMADTFGPVVWVERLRAPALWSRPAWSLLSRLPSAVAAVETAALRDRANVVALARWAAHVAGGETPAVQTPGHLLAVSRLWRQALDQVGTLSVVS